MSGEIVNSEIIGKSVSGASVREAVSQLLKKKGYVVKDMSTGSGVPKFSRLEIEKKDRR